MTPTACIAIHLLSNYTIQLHVVVNEYNYIAICDQLHKALHVGMQFF